VVSVIFFASASAACLYSSQSLGSSLNVIRTDRSIKRWLRGTAVTTSVFGRRTFPVLG